MESSCLSYDNKFIYIHKVNYIHEPLHSMNYMKLEMPHSKQSKLGGPQLWVRKTQGFW